MSEDRVEYEFTVFLGHCCPCDAPLVIQNGQVPPGWTLTFATDDAGLRYIQPHRPDCPRLSGRPF